ncbi:MAG TPA: hypothetical protein VGG53_07720, partial [Mycobacterium sp.]
EIQQRYLPAMIEGRENVAIALTEPGSGSDAGGLTTVARPVNGGWTLGHISPIPRRRAAEC